MLDASASDVDGYYDGMMVMVSTDWQRRLIASYDGASRTATITADWETVPPSGTAYYIRQYAQKEWSDRCTGTHMAQNTPKGVSVEVLVDLCNRVRAAPWFCMPTAASDDYVTRFASYVRDHLDPALKVYIEYSNETWNTGYPGFDYSAAKGAEMGINPWQFHAHRAVQMFKPIFDS